MEGDGHKEKVNEGECSGCIFLFIYENRILKPVQIVLRRKRGEKRKKPQRG
jgi:hypothetical protein